MAVLTVLVHLSDISWKDSGEAAIRRYKKGDQIDAVILAIDPERERISLGVKQMESDPFGKFLEDHPKGSIVTGTVSSMDAKRAIIDLGEGLQGHLRAAELSSEPVKDIQEHLKVGDEITARLLSVDRKLSVFNLSVKAVDEETPREPKSSKKEKEKDKEKDNNSGKTTLGDLFREQVKGNKDND